MLNKSDMHEYQHKAVRFIKDKKRCLLLLSMGLGKTVSTLTAISDLKDSFAVNKVLVIAPLRVANTVWEQEASNWEHLRHLRVSVCTGSASKRLSALHYDADIYVINRENVVWLLEHYKGKPPFDCVVVDESSSFKNPSSQRFKALRKMLPVTEYMILLTGTPSPNGLMDVWSQTYLVDFGMSLGRTITSYRQRFFDKDYFGFGYEIKDGSSDKIHELMKPYTLSMQAEDYLELPDSIPIYQKVQMPAKAVRDYAEFEKELFIELEGAEVEAMSAAVLANKLLQYANGALYVDEFGAWEQVHDAKIDALKEIVEDNDGETMLVAYNFKSDLARLLKAFPDAVVLDKSAETVSRWNSGEIKMLLAHPASAGHGLNLQRGGSLAVWFGLTWSLELYQQFNARLHRQGQLKPVRIVHIVSEGTIDETVIKAIDSKESVQNLLLNALKEKLS